MGEFYTVWSFITRHKIWITVIFFVLMVGVIDENSFWQRRYRRQQMDELRAEISKKREQYERDSVALAKLENDPSEVIRVARESYYMCKSNEEIYVVSNASEDTLQNNDTIDEATK